MSDLRRGGYHLPPTPSERPHIIIEFKQGENIDELKNEALEQILENEYHADLEGEILCLGIAHDKKKCELVSSLVIAETKHTA
jgi:hypothetical protein